MTISKMRGLTAAATMSLAVATAACASGGSGRDDSTTGRTDGGSPREATAPASQTPTSPQPSTPRGEAVGDVPAEILDPILADAAARGGVAVRDVDIVHAEAVTWSDGSLGCPEPGMAYTQALVDGFHVIVTAGDAELDYRADRVGGFRTCETGEDP